LEILLLDDDLLSEMPGFLGKSVSHPSLLHVLRDWFEQISMETYRAFLGELAEKDVGYAAIDSSDFDRDQPSW